VTGVPAKPKPTLPVSDQERSKLPLSVLAAAAILLSGAVLLLVQITMPNPRGVAPAPAEGEKAAPIEDRAGTEPAATGALPSPRPAPTGNSTAIDSIPIEALAKGPGPEENVRPEKPVETLSAGAVSADTLTTEDRVAETGPPETVEPETVRVETMTEPTPAAVTPSEAPIRSEPVMEAEAKSKAMPPEPVRAQSPQTSKPATTETREAPKERQAERSRQTAPPVQPQFRAKPMTLGAPKQAASGISAGAYASKVHAAIARHRRKVAGANGSATVTFAIGPAGGIRTARISRSSGKTQLDQAALASVRSAAPFPPPPQGAKSTYSIQIYFR
jgi:protein TonB